MIKELLSNHNQQIFYYRRVLWQYLIDNHQYSGSYVNFCYQFRKYPDLDSYFSKRNPTNVHSAILRYETGMGKQPQLDWKESISAVCR